MAGLAKEQSTYLERFGDRATMEPLERMLYGHDVGVLPGLIKPVIGNTTPDAVVQPESESELITLTRWAYDEGIPLTPRGKATSGYGGVLPIKKGIVVDFRRMAKVISVDTLEHTVTVEPGISWEKLDEALKKKGQTLRLYPTSYPSSTVGGWLAQGGAGIGSYRYGYFAENVLSVRFVLPSGEVRTFAGADIDKVAGAEGTTGLISEVTIKVRPYDELHVMTFTCPSGADLQAVLESITEQDLPIWNIMFINPRMAEMRNRSPLREHMGHPVEHRIELPPAFVATITCAVEDSQTVRPGVRELVSKHNGQVLDHNVARHEWENRFKIMGIKRLGPSLVPSEVVVPLNKLGPFFDDIQRRISQPFVKEGVVIRKGRDGKPEVVILGFIPADERKLSYNFVFSLSLSIIKLAERYGGRCYATGLYFAGRGQTILGREKLDTLNAFKRQVDPKGLLNPGKVMRNGLMGPVMAVASAFEWAARPMGNMVSVRVGERPSKPVRGIPAHVAWYAYACSQCGYCVDTCDQFYGRGWESQSPRGKWYALRKIMEGKLDWNQKLVDSIISCTTCELCNIRCSASLPIEPSWMKLRGLLIKEKGKMTFPPFEMMTAALGAEGNIWAGYRKNRSDWFPGDLLPKHGPEHSSQNVYFAGCTASYVEQDIGIASTRLLDAAGVDFTYLGPRENCCGTPMLVAGKWDAFVATMRHNVAAVKATGARTVISSCPACDMMWRHVYPQWAKKLGIDFDIRARHYSEVVAEKIKRGEFSFPDHGTSPVTVTWHDSCHMGRVSGVYEPPRDLIKAIPGVQFKDMEHNREEGLCCGSVLTLIKEPPVAAEVGKERLDEAVEVGASKVLALCPCCEFQLRVSVDKKKLPVEVVDLAHFAAAALGYDLPDPHPEVRAQWAVFEAMIALMTPRGFADLMDTMWPELIDAMPLGMGPVMKLMGKVPGSLEAMRPLFPVLFPRLLPMMMPKVMPTMLERVRERVPMPEYMAEQMPTLMPKVMDNLMPHMIDDVVPLVTQPMIDHLRRRTT